MLGLKVVETYFIKMVSDKKTRVCFPLMDLILFLWLSIFGFDLDQCFFLFLLGGLIGSVNKNISGMIMSHVMILHDLYFCQIVNVLEFIGNKEGLQLPSGFAARIAEKSNRSLRRAILSFETCRVQQLSSLMPLIDQ